MTEKALIISVTNN